MVRFFKAVPRLILTPALVLGAVVLVLYLLGIAPDYIQTPEYGPREYHSMQEAESDLGFEIATPSYFPSYLSWPPARIYGQREPSPMVQTLFLSQGGSETLLIYQIASGSEALPVYVPWVNTILQQTPISIDTHEGVLLAGIRTDGQPVNGAYWKSDSFYFIVVTTRSARDLLTIARSM